MTNLEKLAIKLYAHIWNNVGVTADWPIEMGGDDKEVSELISILDEVQTELKLRGYVNQVGQTYMYQE